VDNVLFSTLLYVHQNITKTSWTIDTQWQDETTFHDGKNILSSRSRKQSKATLNMNSSTDSTKD